MRKCNKCEKYKEYSEFYKDSRREDGLRTQCIECMNLQNYEWRSKNQQRYSEIQQKWRENNREKQNEYTKDWYCRNKERKLSNNRTWLERNPNYMKQWRENNKEHCLEYGREYAKSRYNNEPLYALADLCRGRIYKALINNGFTKKNKTEDMLGCSFEKLKEHLEGKFKDGMSWDNHGEWHIDHIVPLSSASTEEEILDLCHYTNLQPLWRSENLSKRDKILYTDEEYEND